MATTEEEPIFVLSGDEGEDDDVVVIKEEPPVKDDDVIFISETKVKKEDTTTALPNDNENDIVAVVNDVTTIDDVTTVNDVTSVDVITTVDSTCGLNNASSIVNLPTSPVKFNPDDDLNKVLEEIVGNSSFLPYCFSNTEAQNQSLDTKPSNLLNVAANNVICKSTDCLNQTSLPCNFTKSTNNMAIQSLSTSLSVNGATSSNDANVNNVTKLTSDILGSNTWNQYDAFLQSSSSPSMCTLLPATDVNTAGMSASNVLGTAGLPASNVLGTAGLPASNVLGTGPSASNVLTTLHIGNPAQLTAVQSVNSQLQSTALNTHTTIIDTNNQSLNLAALPLCSSVQSQNIDTNNQSFNLATLPTTSAAQSQSIDTNNQSLNLATLPTTSATQSQNMSVSCLPLLSSSNQGQLDISSILDMMVQSNTDQASFPKTSDICQDNLPPRKRYKFTNGFNSPDLFDSSLANVPITEIMNWPKCCNKCLKGESKMFTYCTRGHGFCDSCLQELAKQILMDKTKSLKCLDDGCHCSYSVGELKKSLPEMVIELLEKREIDNIAENLANRDKVPNSNPSIPENWCPFEERSTLKVIPLDCESVEFLTVAIKFYESMNSNRCYLHRISRVQNLTLWKYYCLKKIEMLHENDGMEIKEEQLFHGTQAHCVEAITRKGFDWRVCGKHGTLYGEGCYFAKNASYSHDYTDYHNLKNQQKRYKRIQTYQLRNTPLFPPPPPPAHNQSPFFSSPTMNSNPAHQNIPPPAHQLNALYVKQNGPNFIVSPRALPTRGNMPSSSSTETKSDAREPEHVLKMFMSRVLVGKFTGGQRGYRKPPPLFTTDPMGRCYDSCVDNIFYPTIWVIFDSHQCYPDYLVEYTSTDIKF